MLRMGRANRGDSRLLEALRRDTWVAQTRGILTAAVPAEIFVERTWSGSEFVGRLVRGAAEGVGAVGLLVGALAWLRTSVTPGPAPVWFRLAGWAALLAAPPLVAFAASRRLRERPIARARAWCPGGVVGDVKLFARRGGFPRRAETSGWTFVPDAGQSFVDESGLEIEFTGAEILRAGPWPLWDEYCDGCSGPAVRCGHRPGRGRTSLNGELRPIGGRTGFVAMHG